MKQVDVKKLAIAPQHIAPEVNEVPTLDTSLCIATYTISTPAVDQDGDILVPEGCLPHLDRYASNPVVLWSHELECPPVAQSINPQTKALSLTADANRVRASAWFHCLTQESAQAWALVEAGVLRGASVGFDAVPGKMERIAGGGTRFIEWQPLEWSICTIPVNPEALVEAVNRKWDGKALSPMLLKSLRKRLPVETKKVFPLVGLKTWITSKMPWVKSETVQSGKRKGEEMAEETQAVDTQEAPAMPPGAQALLGFTADLENALANLNTALAQVENPDVQAVFEEVGGAIGEQVQKLKEAVKSIYPDLANEESNEEPVEQAEEEATGQEKAIKTKGEQGEEKPAGNPDHAPHMAAILDAHDVCKEMGDSPSIPKSYRMACKGVCVGLKGAHEYMSMSYGKAQEEPAKEEKEPEEKPEEEKPKEEEAKEEVSEADMKAIKAFADELKLAKKEIAKITGKVS